MYNAYRRLGASVLGVFGCVGTVTLQIGIPRSVFVSYRIGGDDILLNDFKFQKKKTERSVVT